MIYWQNSLFAVLESMRGAKVMPLVIAATIIILSCVQSLFAQSFVLSARPEFLGITGAAIGDSTKNKDQLKGKPSDENMSALGFAIESGFADVVFITASFHKGFADRENIGGFLNIGGFPDGNVNVAIGGSLGLHRIPVHVDVINNGVIYDKYTDYNFIIGGIFMKLLFGDVNNFDITPKLMFGFRKCHFIVFEENAKSYRYYYDDSFSGTQNGAIFVFSLGIGYTLTTGGR